MVVFFSMYATSLKVVNWYFSLLFIVPLKHLLVNLLGQKELMLVTHKVKVLLQLFMAHKSCCPCLLYARASAHLPASAMYNECHSR